MHMPRYTLTRTHDVLGCTGAVSPAKNCHGVHVGGPDASYLSRAFQAEAGAQRHRGVPWPYRFGELFVLYLVYDSNTL